MQKIKGRLSGREYDPNEVIKILNCTQAGFYWANGVCPVDCYLGYNKKIVFLFYREETKEVYDLWCKGATQK